MIMLLDYIFIVVGPNIEQIWKPFGHTEVHWLTLAYPDRIVVIFQFSHTAQYK